MNQEPAAIDMDPRQYIEKVCRSTGDVIDEAYSPEQLLVSAHRDYHPADVSARMAMSQLVDLTGDEAWVKSTMKRVRKLGQRSTATVSQVIPFGDSKKISMAMFGLKNRDYSFRFCDLGIAEEIKLTRLAELRRAGAAKLAALPKSGAYRVLLTGGTGFLGQDLIAKLAVDSTVAEVVVVIRPKIIRDRKTGEVPQTVSPRERGNRLLERLGLSTPTVRQRFRFIAGDIEQPFFGIDENELSYLRCTTTHVIHCAASVSFDASYEDSFKANVLGSRNALLFSLTLQEAKNSPFVSHIAIETSYIHGRQQEELAREDELVFPGNFYNNHYELTKAMASVETERFMYGTGLRVVQLCPSIVIGNSRSGNNYGDMKVVNAPVNAFGRAHLALTDKEQPLEERVTGWFIAQMACIFPGDARARLNLIPVDRVADGILGSLNKEMAIGTRVHLATDDFITSKTMRDICAEEIGVNVRLAEPTLHRNFTLPLMTRLLKVCNQKKLASALQKLGTIFGGYGEWGQPVHQVGNDVRILGLSRVRPNTADALRMLCRHNQYVQGFGLVRDADEIARRERVWTEVVTRIEREEGQPAAKLTPRVFKNALARHLDTTHFLVLVNHASASRAA